MESVKLKRSDRNEVPYSVKLNSVKLSWEEKKSDYMKHYMKTWNAQKIECECGKVLSRGNLLVHKKSKFHIDFNLKKNNYIDIK